MSIICNIVNFNTQKIRKKINVVMKTAIWACLNYPKPFSYEVFPL